MKIRRKNWISRLSNLGRTRWEIENETDNLCIFFWRAVLKLAGIVFIIVASSALIILFFMRPDWPAVLIGILWFVSSIFIPLFTIKWLRSMNNGNPICVLDEDEVILNFIKAKKSKICPIIEYID